MQSRKPKKSAVENCSERTAGECTHTVDRKNRGIHQRDEWKADKHDADDDDDDVDVE